jgi:hypothetical protein
MPPRAAISEVLKRSPTLLCRVVYVPITAGVEVIFVDAVLTLCLGCKTVCFFGDVRMGRAILTVLFVLGAFGVGQVFAQDAVPTSYGFPKDKVLQCHRQMEVTLDVEGRGKNKKGEIQEAKGTQTLKMDIVMNIKAGETDEQKGTKIDVTVLKAKLDFEIKQEGGSPQDHVRQWGYEAKEGVPKIEWVMWVKPTGELAKESSNIALVALFKAAGCEDECAKIPSWFFWNHDGGAFLPTFTFPDTGFDKDKGSSYTLEDHIGLAGLTDDASAFKHTWNVSVKGKERMKETDCVAFNVELKKVELVKAFDKDVKFVFDEGNITGKGTVLLDAKTGQLKSSEFEYCMPYDFETNRGNATGKAKLIRKEKVEFEEAK